MIGELIPGGIDTVDTNAITIAIGANQSDYEIG
jgi:hypothetical protein